MIAVAYCHSIFQVLIQVVHGVMHMVIIVDMHMHALQFINFTEFNFKKDSMGTEYFRKIQ